MESRGHVDPVGGALGSFKVLVILKDQNHHFKAPLLFLRIFFLYHSSTFSAVYDFFFWEWRSWSCVFQSPEEMILQRKRIQYGEKFIFDFSQMCSLSLHTAICRGALTLKGGTGMSSGQHPFHTSPAVFRPQLRHHSVPYIPT